MEVKQMEVQHKHKEGVQLFVNKYLGLEVRAVEINGEGWLVGKDVAEALGYSNLSDALKTHVDEEDMPVFVEHKELKTYCLNWYFNNVEIISEK